MSDDACVESLAPTECEPCECPSEGQEGESSALEAWRKGDEERRNRRNVIDRDFPDGAWLRVKVTGPARATPENHVVIYVARLDAEADGQCLSESPRVDAVDAGPVPPAGKDVTIWVNVGEYAGPVYGVAFGKSVQSVTGMVERETPACGPVHLPHSIGISDEAPACEMCVCDD
jgi:hypothetical protein